MLALRSAARAVTTAGIADPTPAQAVPEVPPEAGGGLDPAAPTNPFLRTAAPLPRTPVSRETGSVSVASDGWSPTPWERRLGLGSSSAPLSSARSALPGPSSAPFTRNLPVAPHFHVEPVRPSAASEARRGSQQKPVERSREELPDHQQTGRSSVVGGSHGSRNPTATSDRHREESGRSSSVQMGSGTGSTAATATAAAADKTNSKAGSSGAHGGKRYVTAAEAAASTSRGEEEVAAARPRGSVVERWREMQRKQTGETRVPISAGSQKGPQQVGRRAQAGLPRDATQATITTRPETVGSHSAGPKAAFATAARATARRGDAPEGGTQAHGSAATRDYASLAEASSMELHRLVLSSWTVPELLAAPIKSARGGGGSHFANEGQDKRLLSSLWLPKVSCRRVS